MCKDECRVCGFTGKEVTDRIERFKGKTLLKRSAEEIMRLCDLCACVGSICSGKNSAGYKSINELTIIDFINLLWTVIYKIKDDNNESKDNSNSIKVINQELIEKYNEGFSNGYKTGFSHGYQKCITKHNLKDEK